MLPLGSVGYELQLTRKASASFGWREPVADRLTATRGPGESYSDVILRLIEISQRDAPWGRLG
jgi:hypothetical protein